MPKTSSTRKQRAQELLERIERGPAYFVDDITRQSIPTKVADLQAKYSYQMWVRNWILDDLMALVPELSKIEKEKSA
jgi:hypothetical protein